MEEPLIIMIWGHRFSALEVSFLEIEKLRLHLAGSKSNLQLMTEFRKDITLV